MSLILFCGVFGVGTQFFPGLEGMAFFAGVGALGGLAATRKIFDERELQLLDGALAAAFYWTIVALFACYTVYESLRWLRVGEKVIQFSSVHWLGLVFSLMMVLLGVAGRAAFREG